MLWHVLFIFVLEESKVFEAVDTGNSKTLDELTPVPRKTVLKVGAQVMLLKNINVSKGLVNGARGVITKFSLGKIYFKVIVFILKIILILCRFI